MVRTHEGKQNSLFNNSVNNKLRSFFDFSSARRFAPDQAP